MQKLGISFDTSLSMLDTSRRTLWRRVAEGEVRRAGEDARGRTLLHASDVAKLLRVRLEDADIALLAAADADNATAQNEVGMAFAEAGQDALAVYWWRRAADLGDADSMQLLGQCYAAGTGVDKDPHLAVSWLGKAAAAGHAVAEFQVQGLIGKA